MKLSKSKALHTFPYHSNDQVEYSESQKFCFTIVQGFDDLIQWLNLNLIEVLIEFLIELLIPTNSFQR